MKESMHHKWSLNILAEESNENVYLSIEIEENSKKFFFLL